MYVTGNLINAYFICPRKLWFFAHQLSPDPEWEFLEIGRLISESTFKRDKKEISFEGIKIDVLRRRERNIIVGEIKKSSKGIKSAIMQLAFYLYCLKQKDINLKGELLIPKEKKRIPVELDTELEKELKDTIVKIKEIINLDTPPQPKKVIWCKRCAYNEFCWAEVDLIREI